MPEKGPTIPLPASTYLKDRNFQNWLWRAGFLKRKRVSEDSLVLSSALESRYIAELVSSRGYIVTDEELAERLYGRSGSGEVANIQTLHFRAKSKLPDPDILFKALHLGPAIGVRSLALDHLTIPTTYHLWKGKNNFIPEESLIEQTRGQVDRAGLDWERDSFTRLKAQSSGNLRIAVESVKFGSTLYRRLREVIVPANYTEGPPLADPPLRPYPEGLSSFYQPEYQDWLESIGLLTLHPSISGNPFRSIKIRRGETLKPHEQKLRDFLFRYPGYIVPPALVNEFVWDNDPPSYRVMNANFVSLIDKLEDPSVLEVFRGLGHSYGIRDSRLSRQEFIALYTLWLNYNRLIPAKELALALWGRDDQTALSLVQNEMSRVRSALSGTGFEVGVQYTEKRMGNSQYILAALPGSV